MRARRQQGRPGRGAALAAVAAAALAVAPPAARAGALSRGDLARWFPAPFVVGEREKDLPVWPIFRQAGPPTHTLELAGYAFESVDLAPVPGFSGTPMDLLVALGPTGEFLDVALVSQHEPVFLGGVGEEPLVRFLAQYRGLSLRQNVTVGSGTAKGNRAGSTAVYLDGVAKATASLRILNQSVLSAALRVARAKLGFSAGHDPGLVARERTDLYAPRGWGALVKDGLVRHFTLRNRDVEAGFAAGGEGAGLDAEAVARPDAPFCELWAALATVPMVGRNLLTDAAWRTLQSRTTPGDHVLAVMVKGRCRIVSDAFQRNTVPDRLSLRQAGLPVELRDLDLDSAFRAGDAEERAPPPAFDQAMTFRVIFQAGLDPGEPMQLALRVTRAHGVLYPERYAHDFPFELTVPAAYLVPAASDPNGWVAAWRARAAELAVLVAALALLTWALARRSPLVTRTRLLRASRPAFLAFTLGFVGWYAQGQLSIVNVVAALQAALAGRSLSFFLQDPPTVVLWAFVALTAVVWGRGTFCGWLCPFGALQELVALAARAARVPRWRPSAALDRQLKRVKLAVLAAVLVAALASVRWSDRLVEVEPFKTAITLRFARTWGFTAYAVAAVAAGALVYKAFCRYLCPLGALLALADRVRRRDWLARRVECGAPCQLCRNRCAYQAIEDDGRVHYAECFQCMECVAIHDDPSLCWPLLRARPARAAPRPARPGDDHAA